jgi:hypothetical protein
MTTEQKSALVHTMMAVLAGHGILSTHEWYALCQDIFKNDIVLFCQMLKILQDAHFVRFEYAENKYML